MRNLRLYAEYIVVNFEGIKMYQENDKITIFNGTDEPGGVGDAVKSKIEEAYSSANIEEILLRDLEIKPCVSCFNCWMKTPGKCMIDEHANELTKKMLASDHMVWVTDIVFGSYGYSMKKMLDRMIQIILPYLDSMHGETHHRGRYDKYPSLMIIGILQTKDTDDEKIFRGLIERNRLNFDYTDDGLFIISSNDNEEILDNIFGVAVEKEGA